MRALHIRVSAGSIVGNRHDMGEDDQKIRRALDAEGVAGAAAATLALYGSELFGFLVGVLDDERGAVAVYAALRERIARSLPEFGWSHPLRTWTYQMARRELALRRAVGGGEALALRAPPSVPPRDPTTTISCRPRGLRSPIATLRAALTDEDRELLILRLDRGFDWQALARTSLDEAAPPAHVEREAARLRARLHVIRGVLARAAVQNSLVPPSGDPR
jgi:DNA-directed RNA polymerase specialized sigma24 family protein